MFNLPAKKQNAYINPFVELENLQKEMNRLFDYSLYKPGNDLALSGEYWAPAIDVYDAKDSIVVKADLPGLNKEEIDVSIQQNVLTIKGEKKRSSDVKEETYFRSERFFGAFQRSITLPSEVDTQKIQANFKNGVLELILPKKEEAKPKQIKIDVK